MRHALVPPGKKKNKATTPTVKRKVPASADLQKKKAIHWRNYCHRKSLVDHLLSPAQRKKSENVVAKGKKQYTVAERTISKSFKARHRGPANLRRWRRKERTRKKED